MKTTVNIPVAFSLRDENEFFPMRHVMLRMSPKLTVTQVATGRHVNGGDTVLWGLVHKEGQPLTKQEVEDALREAGFDFAHDGAIDASTLWAVQQKEATRCRANTESGGAVIGSRNSKRKPVQPQGQQCVSCKS